MQTIKEKINESKQISSFHLLYTDVYVHITSICFHSIHTQTPIYE